MFYEPEEKEIEIEHRKKTIYLYDNKDPSKDDIVIEE